MSGMQQRTWVIPPLVDDAGDLVLDREQAADLMLDVLGWLVQTGGRFEIQADRVKVGELPRGGKPPEPIGKTLGFIAAYRGIPKLTDEPVTLQLLRLQRDTGGEAEGWTPFDGTPEPDEPVPGMHEPDDDGHDEGEE